MKILVWDIEIAHSYNEAYQKRMYTGWIDRGVRMSADVSFITHFGFKWKGEKRAYCKSLHEFPEFKNSIHDDRPLIKWASDILQEADHLVAHYGDKFDRKYMNAKLLHENLPPLSPVIKQSDTCSLAKSHLKMSSNRLDNIAEYLGVPMKRKKEWPLDWLKMTKGDLAAYKRVKHYCIGDVITLEQVYDKLIPFDSKQPSHSLEQQKRCCPACGSEHVNIHSYRATKTGTKKRFQCQDCASIRDESKVVLH